MNTIQNSKPLHPSRTSALRRALLLSFVGLSLAFTSGCHKKTSGINPSSLGPTDTSASTTPLPTASLTADPVAIDLGGAVVLNWRTTNANTVTIDGIGPVNANGTQTVSPANSTNFRLVAKGDGGTVEANVRVTVRVAEHAPDNAGTVMSSADQSLVGDQAFKAAVQDVFFGYDSYDLRPDGQQSVVQAAAFLAQHPNLRVLIGGYSDERGSAEYNLALGENRANAAKTGLVNAGVATGRIRVISYGKEKQFCTEANETCWQENRRAQFTIDK